jgi:hypothetical protein
MKNLFLIFRGFLILSLAIAQIGCQKENSADTQYAVSANLIQNSLLKDIRKSKKVVVCAEVKGTTAENHAMYHAELKSSFAYAVQTWSDQLKKLPQKWNVDNIEMVYKPQACAKADSHVLVALLVGEKETFPERASQYHQSCVLDKERCRSFAIPSDSRIVLEGEDFLDRSKFLALHELAHLFGLGDTYIEPGRYDGFPKQPASVMNGETPIPTQDDLDALSAILDALDGKLGGASNPGCPSQFTTTKTDNGQIYCTPKAGSKPPPSKVENNTQTVQPLKCNLRPLEDCLLNKRGVACLQENCMSGTLTCPDPRGLENCITFGGGRGCISKHKCFE